MLLATCSTVAACKGRPNHLGELAELVLGEAAWNVPMGRTAGARRVSRGVLGCARGRLVCRGGRNAFTSYTNYFPHLIATHLHLLTQLTCNSAAALTHRRTTIATLANSPSCHIHALFFACVLFFVATLYQRASVSLVSSTLTQLNSAYEPKRNERLRIRSLRPLVPFPSNGRMHAHPRMYRRINTFGLPQKQPQVTLSNLTH